MKFRTQYSPEKGDLVLDPEKPVVFVGSCFSQNIASVMREHSWDSFLPFGTLYNPLSISLAIDLFCDIEKGKERFETSLYQYNGIWNSSFFDSSFSSVRKEDCLEEFISRQNQFIHSINQGKILIVTFGTSICYFDTATSEVVGNCHKLPSQNFYRRRLSIEEIVVNWKYLIEDLSRRFPGLNIIFTVSPVRHLKDGFTGNSHSKAVLQLAVEEICNSNFTCHYFPAYEILNDDLRDYRFYASDLCHPSEEAIEYIWENFIETYLDQRGKKLLEEGLRQMKSANHRPKLGALGKPLNL